MKETETDNRKAAPMRNKAGITITLEAPEEARTASEIAIVYEAEGASFRQWIYQVILDGRPVWQGKDTDYTLKGLLSGTGYGIQVRALDGEGNVAGESPEIEAVTKPAADEIDITKFGAAGDGATLNTAAIQSAIDACPKGGTVRVPKGCYLTGALRLHSDMTLSLDEGSRLSGSPDLNEYPIVRQMFEGQGQMRHSSLISAVGTWENPLKNIAITGRGTIDACGETLFEKERADGTDRRGKAVYLEWADGVYLQEVTVRHSPAWCVHMAFCSNVTLNGVQIHSKWDEAMKRYKGIFNGDGFDPESCRNVHVFHCLIASQDDCIAVKSGRNEEGRKRGIPSENIRISNCRFASGFGVVIGSEMSGGVRDVTVRDCVFSNTHSFASVKAPRPRGGAVERIVYRNIIHTNYSLETRDCRWFRGALYVDQYYGEEEFDKDETKAFSDETPAIRNILFENICTDTIAGTAIYLAGLPESPLRGITLKNVWAKGKTGIVEHNTEGTVYENVVTEVY